MMKQVNTLAQLLAESDISRTSFEKAILAQDPLNLVVPGVCGIWSIKDIMAHTTAWENRMMGLFDQIIHDGVSVDSLVSGIENDTVDQYNEEIYQFYKDMDLQKIKAAFLENHQILMDFIARLPEERLFTMGSSEFETEHLLWRVVAANTYAHYDEHLSQIEKQTWYRKPKR